MPSSCGERIYLVGVQEKQLAPGALKLTFQTNRGQFDALARLGRGMTHGVVMLGEYGDFAGPSTIYPELAGELAWRGFGSLRLSYRSPGDCVQCGLDALLALQYLYDEGIQHTVMIGWSFGAAVAVAAGSVGRTVRGVASLSVSTAEGCCTKYLRRKPLLVIHGEADRVAPIAGSRQLYEEAGERRRMLIYPGARHDLAEVRDTLLRDLVDWTTGILRHGRASADTHVSAA